MTLAPPGRHASRRRFGRARCRVGNGLRAVYAELARVGPAGWSCAAVFMLVAGACGFVAFAAAVDQMWRNSFAAGVGTISCAVFAVLVVALDDRSS